MLGVWEVFGGIWGGVWGYIGKFLAVTIKENYMKKRFQIVKILFKALKQLFKRNI